MKQVQIYINFIVDDDTDEEQILEEIEMIISDHVIDNELIQSAQVSLLADDIKLEDINHRDGHFSCDKENKQVVEKQLTAKIEKVTCGGTSYFADCPYCGKSITLSRELNTMSAICNKCHESFKLER